MLNTKINKVILFAATALMTPLSFASIIIPSDYNVNASIYFDDINSYQVSSQQTDTITIGANNTSINNSIITGNNPITGSLSDAMSFQTSLTNNGADVDFDSIFYNFDITIDNNSTTKNADFFFNLTYLQNTVVEVVDSFFDDAFVDTTISIEDDVFNSIFNSYTYSDVFTGADNKSGDYGFSRSVNAGETTTISGSIMINGYSFGDAFFAQQTHGTLSLTNIVETSTNVPEPSSVILLLLPVLLLLRGKKN